MNVWDAVRVAERLLPGEPAPDGMVDPRWQAIISIGGFIESDPEAVWTFIERWGGDPCEDLRAAVSTVLLEHLLEVQFDMFFDRVSEATMKDSNFADTLAMCSKFGQSKVPANAKRLDELILRATK